MSGEACPCGRPLSYEACCAPFHQGGEPADAETLMRSRYSAFVKRDVAYLHRTLHPSHDDGETPFPRFLASMRRYFAEGPSYRGLSIHGTAGEDAEGVSKVLFAVKLSIRGKDRSFAEVSSFARDGAGIRYLTGVTMPVDRVRDLHGESAIVEAEARARRRASEG